VFRGTIQKETEIMQVAVKTVKPSSAFEAVNGLLKEIKVMTHIGNHENIVALLGAYTKELKTGKKLFNLKLRSFTFILVDYRIISALFSCRKGLYVFGNLFPWFA